MLVSAKKVDNDTIADLETRVEDRNCSPPLVIDGGTSEKVPSSDCINPQVTVGFHLRVLKNLQESKPTPASQCHLECSLHGACDEDTGVCGCDYGWNGDYACSLEVEANDSWHEA